MSDEPYERGQRLLAREWAWITKTSRKIAEAELFRRSSSPYVKAERRRRFDGAAPPGRLAGQDAVDERAGELLFERNLEKLKREGDKRATIGYCLISDPNRSNSDIAALAGASRMFVYRVRRELEQRGALRRQQARRDSVGRWQPTERR